tara:strand:+ start:100 stop:261 length:162 start_codon:yes stop_codon:yes gene_type:complete
MACDSVLLKKNVCDFFLNETISQRFEPEDSKRIPVLPPCQKACQGNTSEKMNL